VPPDPRDYLRCVPGSPNAPGARHVVRFHRRPGRHRRWTRNWVVSSVVVWRYSTMLVLPSRSASGWKPVSRAGQCAACLPLQQVETAHAGPEILKSTSTKLG
jgi:hypothetical protein